MIITAANGLWAIQKDGNCARWNPAHNSWESFPLESKFIFGDPNTNNALYMVKSDGSVHWHDPIHKENHSYPGINAMQISIGSKDVLWAIQENGIWARWANGLNRWDIYSEKRKFIFADPTTGSACYFVNPDGSVHWRNVDQNKNKSFPGIKAKQVSVGGDNRLWAIQENGVWARWAPEYSRWDLYSEPRTFIYADPTTPSACYFVNPDGSVQWRNVDTNQNETFPGLKASTVPSVQWDPGFIQLPPVVNTSASPAVVTTPSGGLLVAYKGAGSDTKLYTVASADGQAWQTRWIRLPDVFNTSANPAITYFNGRYIIAYKGSGSDTKIYTLSSGDGVYYDTSFIRLPDVVNTSTGPALVVFKQRLYCIYKGSGSDGKIYTLTSSDGKNWDAHWNRLPDVVNTTESPTATVLNGRLHVVYKGYGSDAKIYTISSEDGKNWDTNWIKLPDVVNTSANPSVTVYQNRLSVIYKGSGGDSKLYAITSADGKVWDANFVKLPDVVNSSTGPATIVNGDHQYVLYKGSGNDGRIYSIEQQPIPEPAPVWDPSFVQLPPAMNTSATPSVINTPTGGLLAAYKGAPGDARIYTVASPDGITWDDHWKQLPAVVNTSANPAINFFQGRYIVAYKGAGTDARIYTISSVDGESWDKNWIILPGVVNTSTGPALIVFKQRLYVIYKGSGSDGKIYTISSADGKSWDAHWNRLPDVVNTSDSPSVAVLNGRLHVIYKGYGSDAKIYSISSGDGKIWDPGWMKLPDVVNTSANPSVTVFENRLSVVYKGSGRDTKLYCITSPDGYSWDTHFVKLPDVVNSSTGPATIGFTDHQYVLYKGSGNDARMYCIGKEIVDQAQHAPVGGISVMSSLTENYQADNVTPSGHVYRSIVSFPVGTREALFTAAQEIDVQVDDKTYHLNPVHPVTIPVNALGKMVVDVLATALGLPAIFIHTGVMDPGQRYTLLMDTPGYKKVHGMPSGTLAQVGSTRRQQVEVSTEQYSHAEDAIRHLAQAHQTTYNYVTAANGISRDQYIRPHNMDNLHWSFSKEAGFTPLKAHQVPGAVGNPTLITGSAGQGFFSDAWSHITHAVKDASSIVVHTVKSTAHAAVQLGENAINTVEHIATDAENTVVGAVKDEYHSLVKAGDDLVHGHPLDAASDFLRGQSKVVGDVVTGGENILGDAVEGVENALVITVKTAAGDFQYILDHTGALGAAIKGFLHQVELAMEDVLVWVADKLGWDDILKIQRFIEQTFNDGMDQMPQIIEGLKAQMDGMFKVLETNVNGTIEKARDELRQSSGAIKEKYNPSSTNEAQGHTTWLLSKATNDQYAGSDTSPTDVLATPQPPENLQEVVQDLIKTLEDKFENDQNLAQAINHLKTDFTDLFEGSILDLPEKLLTVLLDVAEIIIDAAIDLINTILDVVLDVFAGLIKWFQEVVNAPINLPFVTEFYKKLTDGEELTVLSFTSLMIAIPAKFLAEFFDMDLSTSLSQMNGQADPLRVDQKIFGYIYVGCMFINGLLNSFLDRVPPMANPNVRANVVDLPNYGDPVSDLGNNLNEHIQKTRAYNAISDRLNNVSLSVSNYSSMFSTSLLLVDALAQIVGNPGGGWKPEKLNIVTSEDKLMTGIWYFQWTQWFFDLGCTSTSLGRAENSDLTLGVQFGMEVIHEFLFLTNLITNGSNWVNWSFVFDPIEGILQTGRMTEIIIASKGLSFEIPIYSDVILQLIYTMLYAEGIDDAPFLEN